MMLLKTAYKLHFSANLSLLHSLGFNKGLQIVFNAKRKDCGPELDLFSHVMKKVFMSILENILDQDSLM